MTGSAASGVQFPSMTFSTERMGAEPAPDSRGQIDFGVSRDEFLRDYFEQKWLLRRSACAESKFTWDDVDELLDRIEPTDRYCKLFRDGEVPREHYVGEGGQGQSKRKINKAAFYDCLSRGATLVLNRVEDNARIARRLSLEAGRFAGMPTSVNAYLSFGGNGTFGKHWDTHDVFVVQLLGKKHWQVFTPTLPLPLSHQKSEPYRGQCPRQPVLDVKLNAGDVLYLPRGWWHQAIPCDAGSFHLSIGAYPPTAMDFVHWMNAQRLPSLNAARAGLGGLHDRPFDTEAILKATSDAMRDPTQMAVYRRSLLDSEQEKARSEFNLALLLKSSNGELAGDTRVALNNCYLQRDMVDAALTIGIRTRSSDSLQLGELHKALIRSLAAVTTTTLQQLYERHGSASRTEICMTLLDLGRHDVVSLWQM